MRMQPAMLIGLLGVGLILAAGAAGLAYQSAHYPKRFGEVVPGKLYRSGEVTPRELEHLRDEYGVRRVLSMLNPDVPESVEERQAAERLGLEWLNIPLTGDGASAPEDRERISAILTDPNAPPTLVHCAAGANRTGLAIGLYRIQVQGWTYEQVLEEMRGYGFRDLDKHENLRAALREAADAQRSRPE